MNSYEITCIRKARGLLHGNHGSITHIGYKNEYSRTQIIEIQKAINMLQNGYCTFYVANKYTGAQIPVVVVNSNGLLSNPYLRTIANGIETDKLEQLPEC